MNMFSHVLLCLTVPKGSTEVSACIELLSALVLQFKRLRALMMIMRTERERVRTKKASHVQKYHFIGQNQLK